MQNNIDSINDLLINAINEDVDGKVYKDYGNSRVVKSGDNYHVQKKNGDNWDHVRSYNDLSDDSAYTNALDHAKKLKEETELEESTKEFGNPIIEMIDNLMSGQLTESNALFYDLAQYKIAEKMELKKIEVAKSILGETKDEEEDEKSDEVGEDEEAKHPLVQLKKIASSEEGIPLKYPEVTASGDPDKRSIRAATDRIKSGKSTSGIPSFKHKNGEESKVSPDHAQHLVNILSGSSLKPDTKKQVLDHIHGSKAGFEKVSVVLGKHQPKEKSIYGDDARA